MASLLQMAEAAQDPAFGARVLAAAAVLKLPHHLPYILQVAANVNLENGPEGVGDDEIFAALQPKSEEAPIDSDPAPIDPEPDPLPEIEAPQE